MILFNKDQNYNEMLEQLIKLQTWFVPQYNSKVLDFYKYNASIECNSVKDLSFILIWEDEPVLCLQVAAMEGKDKTNLLTYQVPSITLENKVKLTTKAAKTSLKKINRIY